MDYKQIETLLERYWEGETTLTEERQLKAYFLSGKVDERLRDVAPLFQTLSSAQQVVAPESVERFVTPAPALRVSHSQMWYKLSAAAVLTGLIATAAWYFTQNNNGNTTGTEVVAHPKVVQPVAPVAPTPQPELVQVTPPTESTVAPVKTFKKKKKASTPRLAPEKEDTTIQTSDDAYSDAEAQKALEEVKAALQLVASKMNKGKRDVAKPLAKVDFDQYF